VVTVGIVATLAAVVVPQVVKQFDAADPTRLAEDLNSIRTAMDAFAVNVSPQQPADIEDLANVIGDADAAEALEPDSSILGSLYSTSDSTAWLGPYVTSSVTAATASGDAVITTGYGATIRNHFAPFNTDATNGGAEVANVATNGADVDFVAIVVAGLSGAAFETVNELIDGATENTPALKRNSGRFRCPDATPTALEACATAFYLAVPINR
jgi:type II secretory pathway pseudopilin PulG